MNWIEQKTEEIVEVNERVRAEFSGIGADKMDFKPDANVWSINECFDHIIQSNRLYHPILDAIEQGTYRGGKGRHLLMLPRLLGKMVVRVVSPAYQGKIKTSPRLYPEKSKYGKNLTGAILEANEVLIGRLRTCRVADLDTVIVVSPVNQFVTYTLRDCIRLLVSHTQRHYHQALRLKTLIDRGMDPADTPH